MENKGGGAMLGAVLGFTLAFVYFYPLTLRFHYNGQQAELCWLPRLCGGYAQPKAINLSRALNRGTDRSKPLPAAKQMLSRWHWRQLSPLLGWWFRHMRLERLYFRLVLAPASPYGFSACVECILSMRCGDIICGIIYAYWLYKKGGKKHV